MMNDRLLFLCIGFALGFIAGALNNHLHSKNKERGNITEKPETPRHRIHWRKLLGKLPLSGIGLFLALALTVYASVQSQLNSNEVAKQQRANDIQINCVTTFLGETVQAANSRTSNSAEQLQANADLQAAQEEFLRSINTSSTTPFADIGPSLAKYQEAQRKFQEVTATSTAQVVTNKYPTSQELIDCLHP